MPETSETVAAMASVTSRTQSHGYETSGSGKAYEDSLLTDWSAPPPNFVIKVVLAILSFMRWLTLKLTPPAATILMQTLSFIPTAWLMMTAKIGIPDLLKDGPLTAKEIAKKAGGLREDDIFRALRMLSAHGFYEALPGKNGEPTRFRNTAATSTLRTDHPNTVRYMAMHQHSDMFSSFNLEPMEWHLHQSGGDEVPCAFEKAHDGRSVWEYLQANPALEEVFSKAMHNVDSQSLKAQLSDFDWSGFQRVIDVGGANGSVLAAVLLRNPQMQGVLFDQPQVVAKAELAWQKHAEWQTVSNRVKMIGGNFFKPGESLYSKRIGHSETLPLMQDGDLIFMRAILHDWSDEESIGILKSLRKAIGSSNVTLALSELTLAPEFSSSPMYAVRYNVDMLMHGVVRGKERTVAEWEKLFAASGFQLKEVHVLRCPHTITEAVPV